MKNDNILGGFDAIFDSLTPNEDIKLKGVEIVQDPNDTSTDTRGVELDKEDDEKFDDKIPGKEDESDDDVENEPADNPDDNSPADNTDDASDEDTAEVEQVSAFFDAIAEQVGWEGITDEEKPKSVEDFVEYMKKAVEESSKPQYASDDVAAIDEYVRNGGSLTDYIQSTTGELDYDKIDITDEYTQKALIRELLVEKGFNDVQIKRKIDKYEDADLLEDEASDAVEALKESKEKKKNALLEAQRNSYEAAIEEQQKFYTNVVEQIEALSDVRGIKIPKEDKKQLMDYIFKVESDGRTRYQKDYSKSSKNLIESAYFTMKGDKLIENAKRSGETSATERLKNTLRTNKVSGSKQTIKDGSPTPLWSIASQQLRRLNN